MVPVHARLGVGTVPLVQSPDVVEAVGDEQGALPAVTALYRFAVEPDEERLVALERGHDALVDRPKGAPWMVGQSSSALA